MGEVSVGDKRRSRGRKGMVSRKSALDDALPDVQPPGGIKEVSRRKDVPAETDEDDD